MEIRANNTQGTPSNIVLCNYLRPVCSPSIDTFSTLSLRQPGRPQAAEASLSDLSPHIPAQFISSSKARLVVIDILALREVET